MFQLQNKLKKRSIREIKLLLEKNPSTVSVQDLIKIGYVKGFKEGEGDNIGNIDPTP